MNILKNSISGNITLKSFAVAVFVMISGAVHFNKLEAIAAELLYSGVNVESVQTGREGANADRDVRQAFIIEIEDVKIAVSSKEQAVQVLESVKNMYDSKGEYYVSLVENGDSFNVEIVQSFLTTARLEAMAMVESDLAGDQLFAYREAEVYSPVEMAFVQEVDVYEEDTPKEEIRSYEEAHIAFAKPMVVSETYVTQEGDTILSIAGKFGITTDELISANPGWDSNGGLTAGSQLLIAGEKALLSVNTVMDVYYEVPFHKADEIVYTEELYEGEVVVIQEAEDGVNQITAEVTTVNGVETQRIITEYRVVKEATPAIVQMGTKARQEYTIPLAEVVISSIFGERWGKIHKGLDFACDEGSAVYASKAGEVTIAGWIEGYGYCVLLTHEDGGQTRYAHLSETQVTVGEMVSQGQQIALSGNTGNSTGSHLHFEIILSDGVVDPYSYLFE